MNRKLGLVLVMLMAGVMAFAAGTDERSADTSSGNFTHPMLELVEKGEKITLTGKIYLSNRRLPELEVNGKVYYLMAGPMRITDDVELENGESITIEGVIYDSSKVETRGPGMRLNDEDVEPVVIVTKAIIQGQEYDLESLWKQGPYWNGRGGRHNGGFGRGMRAW